MSSKYLILISVIFLAKFASADNFGRCQADCKVTKSDMELVRTNALNILREAIIFIKNETNLSKTQWYLDKYREIKEILRTAPIAFPTSNSSPEFCWKDARMRAYVLRYPFDGIINICRQSFDDAVEAGSQNYLKVLSYIMLHETMHLAGESDECAAEGWASAIYMYGQKDIPPKPGWRNYSGYTTCTATYDHREARLVELKNYMSKKKNERILEPWEIFKNK